MEPLRSRLEEVRQRLSIRWEVLERDYLLSWVLAVTLREIGRVEELSSSLAGCSTPICSAGPTKLPTDAHGRYSRTHNLRTPWSADCRVATVISEEESSLGIHLDEWESRIIEAEKGVVRLKPVIQRSRELFWEPSVDTLANETELTAWHRSS